MRASSTSTARTQDKQEVSRRPGGRLPTCRTGGRVTGEVVLSRFRQAGWSSSGSMTLNYESLHGSGQRQRGSD
jgi:hypothetical protein